MHVITDNDSNENIMGLVSLCLKPSVNYGYNAYMLGNTSSFLSSVNKFYISNPTWLVS